MQEKRESYVHRETHLDEMWKQWQIEGGKEKGKENANDEEETTLLKVDEKVKV
jgi:hypothetical protein